MSDKKKLAGMITMGRTSIMDIMKGLFNALALYQSIRLESYTNLVIMRVIHKLGVNMANTIAMVSLLYRVNELNAGSPLKNGPLLRLYKSRSFVGAEEGSVYGDYRWRDAKCWG